VLHREPFRRRILQHAAEKEMLEESITPTLAKDAAEQFPTAASRAR
jgi:hypothetical protein